METDRDQRKSRRQAILAILGRGRIGSQAELVRRLRRRGFVATQSSISRDLRDLGVAKVRGRYVAPERDERTAIARLDDVAHFLRKADVAGPHLTVLVTTAGAAQGVGLAVDKARWPEVVGTVAGDDTLFIATAGARQQRQLMHRLKRIIQGTTAS